MENLLLVAQIITGILLTGAILIQTRGTGFGRGSSHASFTRRGLEKLVFRSTFVLVAIFLIVSILRLAI
jgi:protein translocase SecG subunit